METSARLARHAIPSRRAVLAAGLGAGAAWVVPRGRPPSPIPEGAPGRAPALWVCDRGASRLWALDEGLVPLGSLPAASPVAALGLGAAGLWVLEASGRGPGGERDLVRRTLDGRERLRLPLGPARIVGPGTESGEVVVLRRLGSGESWLQRIGVRRGPATLRVDAQFAVGGGAEVLLGGLAGGPGGGVRRLRATPDGWELVERTHPPGRVLDLAPGSAGDVWALTADPHRVLRLAGGRGRGLAPREAFAVDARAVALVVTTEGPWTVEAGGRALRGARDGRRLPVPGGALECVRPDGSGGAWAACLGAVLHLAPGVGWDRAQGGFDEVVDVAPGGRALGA